MRASKVRTFYILFGAAPSKSQTNLTGELYANPGNCTGSSKKLPISYFENRPKLELKFQKCTVYNMHMYKIMCHHYNHEDAYKKKD